MMYKNITEKISEFLEEHILAIIAVFMALVMSLFSGLLYKSIKVYNLGEIEYYEVVEKTTSPDGRGDHYYNLRLANFPDDHVSTTFEIYQRTQINQKIPVHIIKNQPNFYEFTGSESKEIRDYFFNTAGIFNYLEYALYLFFIVGQIVLFYLYAIKKIAKERHWFGDTQIEIYEWRKRVMNNFEFEKFIKEKGIETKSEPLPKTILEAIVTISPFILGFFISAIFFRIIIRAIYYDYNIGFFLSGLYLFLSFLFFLFLPYLFGMASLKYRDGKKMFLVYLKLVLALFGILNFLFLLCQILFTSKDENLTFNTIINVLIENYGSIFS